MSKGNTTENDLVKFVFNATAMPSYGSILYLALHTADPGEAGDQTSSEVSYGAYARVAVTRDSSGWTVSASDASNTAQATFPEATSPDLPTTVTATHVSIGTASTGAGQILYSGALTDPIAIYTNLTPLFPVGALIASED